MSDIETLRNNVVNSLLQNTIKSEISGETKETQLERIKKQMKTLPSVLDSDTLKKLKDGEYDISLKEYTSFSTYNSMMNALYGNNSANPFQNYVNSILKTNDDKLATAKKFVDKMKENGMSDNKAVNLYSALKSYSLISSFKNYNFVNAKA